MKQPLLKAGTVATIVHTLYPENNIKMCYSASFINNIKGFLRQIAGLHGLDCMDWTGLAGLLDDYGACLQQDTELHKQTATSRSSRHAPYSLKRSLILCMYPLTSP